MNYPFWQKPIQFDLCRCKGVKINLSRSAETAALSCTNRHCIQNILHPACLRFSAYIFTGYGHISPRRDCSAASVGSLAFRIEINIITLHNFIDWLI